LTAVLIIDGRTRGTSLAAQPPMMKEIYPDSSKRMHMIRIFYRYRLTVKENNKKRENIKENRCC
jgi:hypothetical protein